MVTIDIKNISVYNFLEVINSKWIIKQYFESLPNIEEEHFSLDDEKQILQSIEYNKLKNTINKKFTWK